MRNDYNGLQNFDPRDSERSSMRYSESKKITPFITGSRVANVTLALTASVILGAVAIAADVAGYLILCGAKGKEINSKAVTDFAFIPELGSTAFGTLALLTLMYSGAFSRMMRSESTQCMRALMWCMVATNFIVNTVLGFVGDHLFNQDQHADLMQECIWSKLVSLAVLVLVGGATIALGGEQVIVGRLFNLYESVRVAVDEKIGLGTDFYEDGGCRGRLMAWCTVYSSEKREVSGKEFGQVVDSPLLAHQDSNNNISDPYLWDRYVVKQ